MDPRQLLSIPRVYSAFRWLIGSDKARTEHMARHVRAKTGDKILDIGCGPGDILRYLPQVEYIGFDISSDYIAQANARYGDIATFYCAPVTRENVPKEHYFDIAIAHGVLHHLSDSEVMDLFEAAKKALLPGGRLVTFDGCYVAEQSRLARYLVSRDRGNFVRSADAYEQLARQVFPNVAVSIRHDLLRLPYTHIIMECFT